MSPQAKASQARKRAICLLLAGGLVIALVAQPRSAESSAETSAEGEPLSATPVGLSLTAGMPGAAGKGSGTQAGASTLRAQLQDSRLDLDRMILANPFRKPPPAEVPSEPIVSVEAPPPEPPTPPALKAIYGAPRSAAALLGSDVVRPGDRLPDGRAVDRIDGRALIMIEPSGAH